MPAMTHVQVLQYRRDGFLLGLPVFGAAQTAALRPEIEALERDHADGARGEVAT